MSEGTLCVVSLPNVNRTLHRGSRRGHALDHGSQGSGRGGPRHAARCAGGTGKGTSRTARARRSLIRPGECGGPAQTTALLSYSTKDARAPCFLRGCCAIQWWDVWCRYAVRGALVGASVAGGNVRSRCVLREVGGVRRRRAVAGRLAEVLAEA